VRGSLHSSITTKFKYPKQNNSVAKELLNPKNKERFLRCSRIIFVNTMFNNWYL